MALFRVPNLRFHESGKPSLRSGIREVALEQRKLAMVPWSIRFSRSETFRPNTHFYKNLPCRLECVHLPWLEPPPDLLAGDLAFSTDSSSSADDGGETSPWRTIAFALTSFP